jgi:predicted amidophosphoribosyltransferase
MGIAEAMNKPLSTGNLVRHMHTSTQTRKNRFERWKNVEGIFSIKNNREYENMHILLVDDVVTTGSTLEACAAEILKCPGAKVSIATLAYADI